MGKQSPGIWLSFKMILFRFTEVLRSTDTPIVVRRRCLNFAAFFVLPPALPASHKYCACPKLHTDSLTSTPSQTIGRNFRISLNLIRTKYCFLKDYRLLYWKSNWFLFIEPIGNSRTFVMDAEMSPGESRSSNNNNNRSNSNSSTNLYHGSNAGLDSSHKPSSSNNFDRTSSIADDSSNFDLGDDIGWFCRLCTFRNSADKFKCEMCSLRRGTSTRKPRCNAENKVALVVKQQEQIRQQTRVKTPKSGRSTNSTNLNASSPSGSKIRSKTSKSSRANAEISHSDSDDQLSCTNSLPKPKRKKKHDTKARLQKSKKAKQSNSNNRPPKEEIDESTRSDYSDSSDSSSGTSDTSSNSSHCSGTTSETSSTFTNLTGDLSDGPDATIQDSYSAYPLNNQELAAKPTKRPVTVPSPIPKIKTSSENPFKITPLEVSGNLIKYSPPTSSGRTGLIIDKKRFTQHSVTVNDVTITFTEFATRQNTYVRKKKRRDGSRPKNTNGNSRNRSKSQPKSSSNSASTTATEAPQ